LLPCLFSGENYEFDHVFNSNHFIVCSWWISFELAKNLQDGFPWNWEFGLHFTRGKHEERLNYTISPPFEEISKLIKSSGRIKGA
jgi:hypothetical protein